MQLHYNLSFTVSFEILSSWSQLPDAVAHANQNVHVGISGHFIVHRDKIFIQCVFDSRERRGGLWSRCHHGLLFPALLYYKRDPAPRLGMESARWIGTVT